MTTKPNIAMDHAQALRPVPTAPAGNPPVQVPIASTAKSPEFVAVSKPVRRAFPLGRYAVRCGALVGALAIWHLVTVFDVHFFVNFEHVPEPVQVFKALWIQLGTTDFYLHIFHSLQRIAIAYGLAVFLGVALGVMIGRSRWAEDIILPYIELLRPIPAVAWIPLAILMLPSEQSSIVFITFLGALFPIILNTVHGVEQTPDVLLRAARSLGAKPRAILWHVIIPGAMPSIVAGLAIGMGVAWFSLLAGEIISGQYGIGYFTWTSYTLIQYPEIIIGMLTIGGMGTLSTLLVRSACAPLLRWQRKGVRA